MRPGTMYGVSGRVREGRTLPYKLWTNFGQDLRDAGHRGGGFNRFAHSAGPHQLVGGLVGGFVAVLLSCCPAVLLRCFLVGLLWFCLTMPLCCCLVLFLLSCCVAALYTLKGDRVREGGWNTAQWRVRLTLQDRTTTSQQENNAARQQDSMTTRQQQNHQPTHEPIDVARRNARSD